MLNHLLLSASVHELTCFRRAEVSPTTSNKSFEIALNNVIATLPEKVHQKFVNSKSPEEIIGQAQEADNSHLKGSRTRYCLGRVQGILSAADQFLDAVSIAIQHDPHISALVVGAIRLTLSVGLNYLAYFEAISTALETVTDHLPFLRKYAVQLFADSSEVQKLLALTYQDLIMVCFEIWSIFSAVPRISSFRMFSRMLWDPVDRRLNVVKARFEYHTELVIREARAVMYGKDLEEMERSKQERIQSQLVRDRQLEECRLEKRRNILLWLSDLDYSSTQEEILSQRFERSGSWLLERQDFQRWLNSGQSALLWCHGNPGAGKTVLASIVQDFLSGKYGGDPDTGLGYVFCSYRDTQRPEGFIRSYMRQLLTQMSRMPTGVEDRYDELYPDGKVLKLSDLDIPTEAEKPSKIENLFTYVIERFPRVILVFDALDECDDRGRWLLPLLSKLVERYAQVQGPVVKVFITSRRQPDIVRAFRNVPTISILASNIASDIGAYIHHELAYRLRLGALQLQDSTLVNEITKALVVKANGMFVFFSYSSTPVKLRC
jgi:NACHT domain